MADFRRLFTALALVALFVGLASAQGALNGGGGTMACSTTTTVTPTVRSEGFTELVGDVVLNCTGGNALGANAIIPQANITVFLNTQVTSRLINFGTVNATEALLLIDEPGSAAVNGYGATLPQLVCATPQSGCVEYVGNVAANFAPPAPAAPYTNIAGTLVPNSGCTGTPCVANGIPGANVFQGVVSGNAITFYGVPILPPTTAGSRIYRITNLRANANGISGGGVTPGTITGSVSISPSNAFTINQPLNTLAFVQTGLTTSVRNSSSSATSSGVSFNQCNSASFPTTGAGVTLRYGENFPTAFKTRVALTNGNSSTTAQFTGQNIPGNVYNSESGFTLGSIGSGSTFAGLADWGTRLKAVFSNVPSGVNVYVSTANTSGYSNAASGSPSAQLVISETVPDGNGPLPVQSASVSGSTGTVNYAQVTIVNGSGLAVWEVTSNNYTQNQNLDFSVFMTYSASAATNSPLPGPISVNMSYAPNPTNVAFAASSATDPTKVSLIPRFADTSSAKTIATINICQTALLFPFVTTATGFETGLAISNTSQDPFGTSPQTGSCVMNWYQAGSGGTNPAPTTTPAVAGGTTYSTLASNATNAGQNFTGYMIAVCNFQYAHGYAAITDIGARGVFASYLGLTIGNGNVLSRGPSAIETLAH